jgi:nucleotide-binding universal stress UspA family protein
MLGVEGFEIRRAAAERLLIETANSAERADGTDLAVRLEYGPAAAAILDSAEGADVIVAGTRGRGVVTGLLLGSVSQAVVTRAAVPVVVVGHEMSTIAGPVVVGVDDSQEARSALRWAASHAQRHRVPLKVVHAFQPQHFAGLFGMAKLQPDVTWRSEATRGLAELIDAEVSDAGGLELDAVATQAGPAAGLLGAAEEASLIVVGTRGSGQAASVLFGSVGSEILKRARCPVVIVPRDHHRLERGQGTHSEVAA